MGFLTKSAKGEDTGQTESSQLEEQYEKLFPKIGRDFVSKRDLDNFLQRILLIIDPFGITPISFEDSEARALALEYKVLLDAGKDGSKFYKDLVDLDEE